MGILRLFEDMLDFKCVQKLLTLEDCPSEPPVSSVWWSPIGLLPERANAAAHVPGSRQDRAGRP